MSRVTVSNPMDLSVKLLLWCQIQPLVQWKGCMSLTESYKYQVPSFKGLDSVLNGFNQSTNDVFNLFSPSSNEICFKSQGKIKIFYHHKICHSEEKFCCKHLTGNRKQFCMTQQKIKIEVTRQTPDIPWEMQSAFFNSRQELISSR